MMMMRTMTMRTATAMTRMTLRMRMRTITCRRMRRPSTVSLRRMGPLAVAALLNLPRIPSGLLKKMARKKRGEMAAWASWTTTRKMETLMTTMMMRRRSSTRPST
jgi:hypothetical protein